MIDLYSGEIMFTYRNRIYTGTVLKSWDDKLRVHFFDHKVNVMRESTILKSHVIVPTPVAELLYK